MVYFVIILIISLIEISICDFNFVLKNIKKNENYLNGKIFIKSTENEIFTLNLNTTTYLYLRQLSNELCRNFVGNNIIHSQVKLIFYGSRMPSVEIKNTLTCCQL